MLNAAALIRTHDLLFVTLDALPYNVAAFLAELPTASREAAWETFRRMDTYRSELAACRSGR